MAFVERLKIILDMEGDHAKTGLRAIGKEISAADGLAGKFKAGWKGAMDTAKANAAAFATVAGAALVTFGIKAVHAFESTAKAAVDLGKATGLSTEQASRWIAVGDDYEVSAPASATALAKVGKSLDSAAFDKYGIATHDAAGNARDANDIFLDVLDTLNNTAPAERAKVGTDLLGKGYKELAPLVGKSRAEYEKMLSTVEAGQVVTEKEAKKAERMRLAEDKLKDALGEVTLAVGDFVAGMAPMIESLSDGITAASGLSEEFGLLDKAVTVVDFTNPITAIQKLKEESTNFTPAEDMGLEDMVRLFKESGVSAEQAIPQLERWIAKNQDAGLTLDDLQKRIYGTVSATQELSPSAYDAARMLDKQAKSTRYVSEDLLELQGILDDLSDEEAALDLADQFAQTEQASKDAFYAVASGAEDADQQVRDAKQSVIDLKTETAKYATEVAGLPPSKVTQILALIDEGKFAEADALLKKLTMTRTVTVVPVAAVNGSDGSTGNGGYFPHVGTPGVNSVRETRGGGGDTYNFYGVTTPMEIVDAITKAKKDGARADWMANP